jgi:hypothetical protein
MIMPHEQSALASVPAYGNQTPAAAGGPGARRGRQARGPLIRVGRALRP